jgi:hypothetical protein
MSRTDKFLLSRYILEDVSANEFGFLPLLIRLEGASAVLPYQNAGHAPDRDIATVIRRQNLRGRSLGNTLGLGVFPRKLGFGVVSHMPSLRQVS